MGKIPPIVPMASELLTPLRWVDNQLLVLDQRLLPLQTQWLHCRGHAEVADAIAVMAVRGAPAIGLAGAYGLALAAREGVSLQQAARTLAAARPTAVHLQWALDALQAAVPSGEPSAVLAEAQRLHAEDADLNLAMARHGAALLSADCRVMTHCNTGALATGGWGTALGVIRVAHATGRLREVLAGETRPWLQGARLTAWELQQEGIPFRLVADGAMAWAMHSLRPDWVIVGADRIAANGDTANKIGTYSLATLARAHGVKMMVVAPVATIDWSLEDGRGIPIEERGADELTRVQGRSVAPQGAQAWNPVFDVTPAHLIDVIVSEKGVLLGPDKAKLAAWKD